MMSLILLTENFKKRIVHVRFVRKPNPEVPTETSILRTAFPPPKLGGKSGLGFPLHPLVIPRFDVSQSLLTPPDLDLGLCGYRTLVYSTP